MVFHTRWSGGAGGRRRAACCYHGAARPRHSAALLTLLLIAALLLGRSGGQERRLLGNVHQLGEPIRIGYYISLPFPQRDCTQTGALVQVGEPEREQHLCSTFSTPRGAYNQVMDDNCWYVCEAGDTLTDDQRAFLDRVATGAFAWLASAVAVRPVAEPITLADLGACDGDQHVRLPSDLARRGAADADLFLVVSVRPQRGGQPATSRVCTVDDQRRAVVGHVSLAPSLLPQSAAFEDIARKERLLDRLLLHEVAHVLGFRMAALRAMGQEAGLRWDLESGSRSGQEVTGATVLREARRQYGAPDLAAVPLAEQPLGGANGSAPRDELHWAADWGMGELMAGEVSPHSAFSALSLAFLEDIGWYHVNFSAAEDWRWGRGGGDPSRWQPCRRGVQGMCHKQAAGARGCTFDRRSKGGCSKPSSWKQLSGAIAIWEPPMDSQAAGDDDTTCQMIVPGDGLAEDCVYGLPVPGAAGVEYYGADSRCFELTEGAAAPAPVCLRQRCTPEGRLELGVDGAGAGSGGGNWTRCPQGGGSVVLPGAGVVSCPPAAELCDAASACPDGCSGNGRCSEEARRCECRAGWTGQLCDQLACPDSCAAPTGTCADGICRCAPGFSGLDCSTTEVETCDEDCDGLGYPAVCVNGACEPQCSLFREEVCLDSADVVPHMQICNRIVSQPGLCSPLSSGGIADREDEMVIQYLDMLAPPVGPFDGSSQHRQCRQTAIRLACMTAFPGCERSGGSALPACKSVCLRFVAECGMFSMAPESWCDDTALFRPDQDLRGCAYTQEAAWLSRSLQTMSIYALVVLGSCFILYALYRVLRVWYLYTTYGRMHSPRDCCAFMVSALCPSCLRCGRAASERPTNP